MIGAEGGRAVQSMLENTQKPSSGITASVIGILTLLFGASGAFGELRSALNKIWDVKAKNDSGLAGMLRERFFSFGMVLSIGFLLMASLLFSAGLAAIGKFFTGLLPMASPFLSGLDFLVSFMGIAALFALIFKFVPETKVDWGDVRVGAIATALLFTIGKTLIGVYLGRASVRIRLWRGWLADCRHSLGLLFGSDILLRSRVYTQPCAASGACNEGAFTAVTRVQIRRRHPFDFRHFLSGHFELVLCMLRPA